MTEESKVSGATVTRELNLLSDVFYDCPQGMEMACGQPDQRHAPSQACRLA